MAGEVVIGGLIDFYDRRYLHLVNGPQFRPIREILERDAQVLNNLFMTCWTNRPESIVNDSGVMCYAADLDINTGLRYFLSGLVCVLRGAGFEDELMLNNPYIREAYYLGWGYYYNYPIIREN